MASEIYIERKSRERGAENNKNTLKGGNPETTGGGAECSQRQNHAAAISPGTEETRRSFSTKSKYFEGNKPTIKDDDLLRVGSCAPSISSLVENVERRLPGKEQTNFHRRDTRIQRQNVPAALFYFFKKRGERTGCVSVTPHASARPSGRIGGDCSHNDTHRVAAITTIMIADRRWLYQVCALGHRRLRI